MKGVFLMMHRDYPAEYVDYLIHFHGHRDFFECHEILEEYWKSQSIRQNCWVALIQLAVGLYHHRRGNFAGAKKMLLSSMNYMDERSIEDLGLNYKELQLLLNQRLKDLEEGQDYTDISLPISDPQLKVHCLEACEIRGVSWDMTSTPDDRELIHRHKMRDRTDVIQERQAQKERKRREFFADIHNIYCIEKDENESDTPIVYLKPTHSLHPAHGLLDLPKDQGAIYAKVELVVKLQENYDPDLLVHQLVKEVAIGINFTLSDEQTEAGRNGHPWLLAKGFKNSSVLSDFFPMTNPKQLDKLHLHLYKNGTELHKDRTQSVLSADLENIIHFVGSQVGLGMCDVIYTGTIAELGFVSQGDRIHMRIKHPDGTFDKAIGPLHIRAQT
jgi:predicted metal-dependent hydrolase